VGTWFVYLLDKKLIPNREPTKQESLTWQKDERKDAPLICPISWNCTKVFLAIS